jgi:hypothetical protein
MRLRTIAADGALPDSADGRLQRFLDYWRSKCQADRLPHRRDIDPTEIIPLLAAIFLMDVEAGDFRFRLVGQDIVTRYGALKGRKLGELMAGDELAETIAEHRHCVQARLPVYAENTMKSAGAGDWLLYQRLLTPLAGDDGAAVATLAGVMVFRDYRDEARAG